MTVTATAHAVKVGDFFYASWGYDQTNIDFYKVVGFTPSGKSVRIQKWSSAVVQDNGPQVYVVPGDSPATTVWAESADGVSTRLAEAVPVGVETKLVQYSSFSGVPVPYLAWASYASLSLWDGKPKYETGAGWGH